jgi:hypothetical protein
MKPPKLGTINGYISSIAKVNGKPFDFDGTCKGLTIAALKAGAKVGDIIHANYGGRLLANATSKMILIASPGDTRTGGYWVSQVWS